MALSKVFVSLMLLISLISTVSSTGVIGGKALPPKKPPVAVAPAYAPIYSPAPSPIAVPPTPAASPPVYAPVRRLIAVQGVVYGKPCSDWGHDTLMHASPLPGAEVRLVCHGKPKENPLKIMATTDKNGYFFILATKKVSEYGAQKRCRVFLQSAPTNSKFIHSTHMNGGLSGAYLRYTKPAKPLLFALYTVGPFAYEPLPSVCHQKV
ncbi:hypothetical protein MKW94_025787 [Papaver nudicaule]|uniref:Uncharacterized protein n=1 Tax=Papaver nudicaule TaxID=74823 RepID=A0AA41RQ30_PAPNU|nr:hypothetical protein [Papaver nudicaule]